MADNSLDSLVGKAEITAIKSYRALCYPVYSFFNYFHLNMASCRYTPSCSHYAEDAIKEFGALKGTFLAVKRLARCAPWGGYGYDPVPKNDCCSSSHK